MTITIINTGSGIEKVCTFEAFGGRGAWAEIRYPGAAGLFAFSLVHGGMECKRDEHAPWRLGKADLAALRVLATEKGIKFSTRPKQKKGTPKKPGHNIAQRQTELFK